MLALFRWAILTHTTQNMSVVVRGAPAVISAGSVAIFLVSLHDPHTGCRPFVHEMDANVRGNNVLTLGHTSTMS